MINITSGIRDAIYNEGIRTYPGECCGALIGEWGEDVSHIKSILPIVNHREADEQYHRFEVTPEDYMRAERYAMDNGHDVIGFYHSHPNCEAVPSAYDLEHALPNYSYVIISVIGRDGSPRAIDLTSWRMAENRSRFVSESVMARGC